MKLNLPANKINKNMEQFIKQKKNKSLKSTSYSFNKVSFEDLNGILFL